MVYDRSDVPVGFVRLFKTGSECEIVLVIGDRENWGRRLGASAILEGLKLAFLDMRAKTVIAKIHPNNERSLRAFQSLGFTLDRETPTLKSLFITSTRYRQLLRDSIASASGICITEVDKARLGELMAVEQGPAMVELEHEIERAMVVDPQQVSREVVTMNSRVALLLDDASKRVLLVYPKDADERAGKLSVLSDVGAASFIAFPDRSAVTAGSSSCRGAGIIGSPTTPAATGTTRA